MCNGAEEKQAHRCEPYGLRVQEQPLFWVCSRIVFYSYGSSPIEVTSKMRFTNNRLMGLQTIRTWLGSSRLRRIQQQNYKCTWLMVIAPI